MSNNWRRAGDWVHIEVKPKPIDPMVSRTYMPGYDMGDWLTLKSDDKVYTAIQVTEITIENPYNYNNQSKDELFIHFKKVEIKERPDVVDTKGLRNMLRWELNRWGNNCLSYTELLKEYRPLTDNEKLLYVQE